MKNFCLLLIPAIFFSCQNSKNNTIAQEEKRDSIKFLENSSPCLNSYKCDCKEFMTEFNDTKINLIYSYGDSVPLYQKPSKNSQILKYVGWYSKLLNNKDYYGSVQKCNFNQAFWYSVKFENIDTAWIYFENATFNICIDTLGQYCVAHQFTLGDFAYIAYNSSFLLKNMKTIKELGFIDAPHSAWINRRYFYYTKMNFRDMSSYAKIWLFDFNTAQHEFISNGRVPVFSNSRNSLIFLKETSESNKRIAVELCEYNLDTKIINVLYNENTDSTQICCQFDDYESCTEITISDSTGIESYKFNLFIPDTISAYSNYIKYELEVDQNKNLIKRMKK